VAGKVWTGLCARLSQSSSWLLVELAKDDVGKRHVRACVCVAAGRPALLWKEKEREEKTVTM